MVPVTKSPCAGFWRKGFSQGKHRELVNKLKGGRGTHKDADRIAPNQKKGASCPAMMRVTGSIPSACAPSHSGSEPVNIASTRA